MTKSFSVYILVGMSLKKIEKCAQISIACDNKYNKKSMATLHRYLRLLRRKWRCKSLNIT